MRATGRLTWFLSTATALALVVSGCAGSSTGSSARPAAAPAATRTAALPTTSAPSPTGPSAVAQMICGDEIASAVQKIFLLPKVPTRTDSWSGVTYRCDYRIGAGTLHLSVADYPDDATGTAFFRDLREKLPAATGIVGPANFGFPAFQTPTGEVAFLKDGKTLLVDATALPAAVIPADLGRQGTASSTAAAVLECWTE